MHRSPGKAETGTVLPRQQRAERMHALADKTALVSEAVPRGARIGFVDYPMHINLGDLLILMGALDFFRWNENEIHTAFCLFDQTQGAFERLKSCDVIVCHGGGNFGDIYPKHQKLREHLAERFPDKPIVVMPQSIHFSGADAMKRSAAVCRRHPNFTMFVRDEYSLRVAREHFSDNVVACPDMAHRLFDRFSMLARGADAAATSDQPLRLMRRDVEATARQPGGEGVPAVDWADIITTAEKARIWRHRGLVKLAGTLGTYDAGRLAALEKTLDAVVPAVADRLLRFDAWHTSRLHGAIFGLLLERDVTLFDNSYGKNSRYFSLWGRDLVRLASSAPRPAEAVQA